MHKNTIETCLVMSYQWDTVSFYARHCSNLFTCPVSSLNLMEWILFSSSLFMLSSLGVMPGRQRGPPRTFAVSRPHLGWVSAIWTSSCIEQFHFTREKCELPLAKYLKSQNYDLDILLWSPLGTEGSQPDPYSPLFGKQGGLGKSWQVSLSHLQFQSQGLSLWRPQRAAWWASLGLAPGHLLIGLVSWVHTCVKISQTEHVKYAKFILYKLYLYKGIDYFKLEVEMRFKNGGLLVLWINFWPNLLWKV